MEQQAGKRQEMESGEGLRQPLIVTCQAAEARHPSKGAFHHPAARQQHEAPLGVGQLDDLQPDALLLGGGAAGDRGALTGSTVNRRAADRHRGRRG